MQQAYRLIEEIEKIQRDLERLKAQVLAHLPPPRGGANNQHAHPPAGRADH